ncbi:hypothetical protein ACWCQW_03040 [Streptomyces mirabilis]
MKIVKETGEQPIPRLHRRIAAELRPILAIRGAGASLYAGSRILIHRGWTLLGERLDGWERYGALAFGGYVTVYGCSHAPHLARFAIPAAAITWCVAAWWAAPPAAVEEPAPEPAEPAVTDARAAFVRWLLDLIGDRPGIHLRELYPAMRRLPGNEARTDTQLRAALTMFRIPVHRSMRDGVTAGRTGVRRDDLTALPSLDVQGSVETGGDAGQSADSPALSTVGEDL